MGRKPGRTEPTQERLKELFDYHPEGGLIRKTKAGRMLPGSVVGLKTKSYSNIVVDGMQFVVPRLIYIWHHGEIPEGYEIDHIDRTRNNHRIDNLRSVLPWENLRNRQTARWANKDIVWRGVCRDRRREKYIATATVNGKSVYLGTFKTAENAAQAYNFFMYDIGRTGYENDANRSTAQ